MEIKIKRGSKGNPIMIVKFEKDTNYDPKKHEWVPKKEEVKLIMDTLNLLLKWKPDEG